MRTKMQQTRLEWLQERDLTEVDVMYDEYWDREFILTQPSIMDEGELEDYSPKRIYLPLDLLEHVCKRL